MADIKPGDRVRIKDRPDWPLPSGYKLTNEEGRVVEIVEEPQGYATVLLDNEVTGIDTQVPLGFRLESLEKI